MTRGRAPNLSLPPTRQLANQRDYRARKAQHLADLETKVKLLEARVGELEEELRLERAAKGVDTGLTPLEVLELKATFDRGLGLIKKAYPLVALVGVEELPPSSPTTAALAVKTTTTMTPNPTSSAPSRVAPSPSPSDHEAYNHPSTYFQNPPPLMSPQEGQASSYSPSASFSPAESSHGPTLLVPSSRCGAPNSNGSSSGCGSGSDRSGCRPSSGKRTRMTTNGPPPSHREQLASSHPASPVPSVSLSSDCCAGVITCTLAPSSILPPPQSNLHTVASHFSLPSRPGTPQLPFPTYTPPPEVRPLWPSDRPTLPSFHELKPTSTNL